MGRRAVVESTQRKRHAVVILPGTDPKGKLDRAVGAAGGLLLLLAVILVPLLPQDAPVPAQYQVAYEVNLIELPGETFDLTEGAMQQVAITYAGDRLYRIEVAVEWTDDRPESLPDAFELTLLDPSGDVQFGPETFSNAQPVATGNELAPIYEARTEERTIPATMAPRPTTAVLTAADGESAEQIASRIDAESRVGGAGDWLLNVKLVNAGDCPDPSSFDPARTLQCEGTGPDNSNAFHVLNIIFTEYIPTVTSLES